MIYSAKTQYRRKPLAVVTISALDSARKFYHTASQSAYCNVPPV